jgi:hypothetical protein
VALYQPPFCVFGIDLAAEALWAPRPSTAPITLVEIKAKQRALLTIMYPKIWRGVLNIV